jgi:K+-sensing histidine kinase KdpD
MDVQSPRSNDADDDAMPDRGQVPNQVLIAAYEAALAVASEVDPQRVLHRIVEVARQVVPARYAALGVADDDGMIVQFITSGMSEAEERAIGDSPQGHGLLGVLITEQRPLRIRNIQRDPRSAGFPANHPPMRSLLGVPIVLGDRALGNLYLTERVDGGPFTEEDEAALGILAAYAAAAIDRAHLFEEIDLGSRRSAEQRDHLRVILDNLPSGVLIVHEVDGEIDLANTVALKMLSGPETAGDAMPRHGRDYRFLAASGGTLPRHERPDTRALAGETVRNLQITLERWNGRHVPLLVQAAPLNGSHARSPRAVLVLQDVTKLRQAEQLKDDFLSLVSHEFRTPLTAIHGGAHLLGRQWKELDEETRAELLEDIASESDRLNRMLGNMLSLAAIQAGQLRATTEPVAIEPLARRVSQSAQTRSADHRFIVDIADDLPPGEADPELLEQVLRNLYENAVKYSPNGGEVRTTATAGQGTVTIHVSDEGIGIARDQVARVFERFHRAGVDPTVRGMGLGLYLCRHLVEAQDGLIAASSPGPGMGSTFSVTLPQVAAD